MFPVVFLFSPFLLLSLQQGIFFIPGAAEVPGPAYGRQFRRTGAQAESANRANISLSAFFG
jgi:hypothetical protein